MEKAEAYRPMTPRMLYDYMDRFASDNERSNDVDTRWLATKVNEFKPAVSRVMNSRLEPDERAAVNTFRAGEIELELENRRRDVNKLERVLQQLRA